VLTYSRSEDYDARDAAIMALQAFRQDAASDRLVELLKSDDPRDASYRSLAALALANRGDERGLPALADEALRGRSPISFEALAAYPDVPIAMGVIKTGLQSTNAQTRMFAERAMHAETWMVDPIDRKPPPPAIANLTTSEAAKILLETDEFALIDPAAPQAALMQAIAFRAVQSSGANYAAASYLYRKAKTPGRLYALCGMYMQSDGDLARKAAELIQLGGNVTLIEAGQRRSVPIDQLVKHIVSGEYPQNLLRLYAPPAAASK
jgi:HEAT repeat protein